MIIFSRDVLVTNEQQRLRLEPAWCPRGCAAYMLVKLPCSIIRAPGASPAIFHFQIDTRSFARRGSS
jgi:hypothetical protein